MTTSLLPLPAVTRAENVIGVNVHSPIPVPTLVQHSGERAYHKFIEYFIGQLRNPNTREAYARAVSQFFCWCERQGASCLEDVSYLAVAAYIEQHPASPPTVLQHLAAIRRLFTWLQQQGVLVENPAANVKGPKHRVKIGKTPVLNAEEMRQLLDSFDTSHIIGLRDRAIISLMTFTFARISAVVDMNIEDYLLKGSRHWVRLHEKGGKYLEVPLHHLADDYLHTYIDGAAWQLGKSWEKGTPLFRAQQKGRLRLLGKHRLHRCDAWAMIKRRAADADITTDICNHTFRGTGITNYLENGGNRDTAQELAGHEDIRTTALYDRRSSKISLDEIERMRF